MESMDLIKAAVSAVDPSKTQKLGTLHRQMQIRELGMDSVATMEMVAYLEDKLETQFADEVMIRIETFGDLVDLIDRTKRG
jgi:acyl carrier protein